MSQTVKYILGLLIVFAVILFTVSLFRTCQSTNEDLTNITTDESESPEGEMSEVDAAFEELYSDEEEEDITDSTDLFESDEPEEDPEKEAAIIEEDVDVFEDRAGDFLVVAGAFVSKSNADRYQKDLINQGYDAEVRIFLGSDYHSVILGDYETETEAQAVASKIGAEAYVHKRRYPKKKG